MSKSRKQKEGGEEGNKDANELLTNAMLRSMIDELQQSKMTLVLNVKELTEKLEQQKADHADIYYYLNKKCDDNYEMISHLEEQIVEEQNSRELAEKGYEKRMEEMKTKFGFEEVKYQAKIAELEDKNQSLKDFGERRAEMEENLSKLMSTLEEERQQYKRNITDIENKSIYEKELLRKDFERRLAAESQEILNSIGDRLPGEAKKAYKAFMTIQDEMTRQNKQANQLLAVTKLSIDHEHEMKRELELAENTNQEMAKKLAMYQNTIKELNAQLARHKQLLQEEIDRHELEKAVYDKSSQDLRETVDSFQKKLSVEDSQMDEMWFTLRKAYDNQLKMKARIYQRKGAGTEPIKGDFNEGVVIALLQEAVKKYPEKFPMSMFFEPGLIDNYRKSLAHHTSWTALKESVKFPPLDSSQGTKQHSLFVTKKVPDKREISVQTEGPIGSSDIRFASSNSRPVSRSRVNISLRSDMSDNIDTNRLNIFGEKLSPTQISHRNETGRRRQFSPSSMPSQSIATLSVDDDQSSITFNQSQSVDDSMSFDSSHFMSIGAQDDSEPANPTSSDHTEEDNISLDLTGKNDDGADDNASETSKSIDSSVASLLTSQSTTYGYIFPKGGVEPAKGINSGRSASSDAPKQKHRRGMKVKYMKQSPAATTFLAQQMQYNSLPPGNQVAYHSRMEELESWREQRLSRDKKKRMETARNLENSVGDLSLSIQSIVPGPSKLSPLVPSPPVGKKLSKDKSSSSIRSNGSSSGVSTENLLSSTVPGKRRQHRDDASSVASSLTELGK